jgi:hypothetical protein
VLIFTLALVLVVEFLTFFQKLKLQNISGSHAATCRQKQAADFPLNTHCHFEGVPEARSTSHLVRVRRTQQGEGLKVKPKVADI